MAEHVHHVRHVMMAYKMVMNRALIVEAHVHNVRHVMMAYKMVMNKASIVEAHVHHVQHPHRYATMNNL